MPLARLRALLPLLLPIVAAGCGGSPTEATATPPSPVVVLTAANFQGLVLESSLPCLVEFYSPTCPACQAMTDTVEDLARDVQGSAVVGTVNGTVEGELFVTYQIVATPTFVLFADGEERRRRIGAMSYQELAALLDASAASSF
jgi:thioredoxin 1